MINFLYLAGIYLYTFVIALVSPFNSKAMLLRKGRRSVFRYLRDNVTPGNNIIWIHCASLGEFEQGRPLIEAIKEKYPRYKFLLTFFSPSGYEVRKNYPLADYVCYLPADTPRNARKFIGLVNPDMAIFIKYEFWYNYIRELNVNSIPLYLVSAIFRPEQLFFRKSPLMWWCRRMLAGVSHFFVQNEASAALLKSIGIRNSTVTGDTRFDRVAAIAAGRKELPVVAKFKGSATLIVVGSSWPPDEEILARYLESKKDVKMIFAPHEVDETNIRRLSEMLPEKVIRYSGAGDGENTEGYRIMVIDSIGILSSIYSYADLAYIGGGFGVGIHNTLEAAVYNIPVLFGPNYRKFHEAVELVRRGIAFPVNGAEELAAKMERLTGNEDLLKDIEGKCKVFMAENAGATKRILRHVFTA